MSVECLLSMTPPCPRALQLRRCLQGFHSLLHLTKRRSGLFQRRFAGFEGGAQHG